MDNCFWCGEPVGHTHVAIIIGGMEKKFHSSLMKDCANEYNKWRVSREVEPYLKEVHLERSPNDTSQSEHRNGTKGAGGNRRLHPRLAHPYG